MPLSIMLATIVLGFGAIYLALRRPTGGGIRPLGDDAAVGRAWLRENPDCAIQAILVADDRETALVRSSCGPGLVWSIGEHTVARLILTPPRIRHTATGMRVRPGDFAAPRIDIRLADPHITAQWIAILRHTQETKNG